MAPALGEYARDCDVAVVGGGLAGGLIALALKLARPEISVRLIEETDSLGGNHRWSWFASDVTSLGAELLRRFRVAQWDNGYDVAFPGYKRHLRTAYRSLSSHDFAFALARDLPPGTVLTGRRALSLDARGVTLADGERIDAGAVIDARGFEPTALLGGGWQVFLGHHLRTSAPHGVRQPVIMDATVDQLGGYRFVYVLPLSADELFLEDTYYQDSPALDRAALTARLDDYCRAHGWQGELLGAETGVLPVVTGGSFAAWQASLAVPGVARAGARGGFVHPLTSYTLPFAVETALIVARDAGMPGEKLAAVLAARARMHWNNTRFYRRLGAMLFGAARDEERWRVFGRFYGLSEPLIERFYAARSTPMDRARILIGKPPVPIGRAFKALTGKQPPLKAAA